MAILSHSITWMNLERMLRQKKLANYKRTNIEWPHSYEIFQVVKSQGIVVARGLEKERMFNSDGVSILQDQKSSGN